MKLTRLAAIYASLMLTKLSGLRGGASESEMDAWCKFDSPAELGFAMLREFRYRADGLLDYALPPKRFFQEKQDDCDGFAMFAEWCMNKLGWADVSRIYVRASSDRAHVIAVCKFNGQYWQVGNWHPFALRGSALQEIGQEISEMMEGGLSFAVKFKNFSYQEYVAQ